MSTPGNTPDHVIIHAEGDRFLISFGAAHMRVESGTDDDGTPWIAVSPAEMQRMNTLSGRQIADVYVSPKDRGQVK